MVAHLAGGSNTRNEIVLRQSMMRPALLGAFADRDERAHRRVGGGAEHRLGERLIAPQHRRGVVAALRRREQQVAERDVALARRPRLALVVCFLLERALERSPGTG